MTFKTIKAVRGIPQVAPVLDALRNKKAFICGGYARYMASPNTGKKLVKAGDVDIYCEDEATFEELYAHFKDAGLEIRWDNPMAITYLKAPKGNRYHGCPVIQLIKPVEEGAVVAVGNMDHILSNFDFTVIRAGVIEDPETLEVTVMVDEDFEDDEEKKYLRIKNIHCPISSMLRFMKYGRKGYHTRPAQIMKLFVDWDARPLSYRNRLQEIFQEGWEAGELSQEEIDELESLLRID